MNSVSWGASFFLEQVGAVQSRVGFGDPGQLVPLSVGEVVGVVPQRVAGAFQPAGIAGGDAICCATCSPSRARPARSPWTAGCPGPAAAASRPSSTLAKRITAIREKIHAALDHGLSNALIESVNTKIRLLTRIAFGFRSPDALIALAMLSLGGHRPHLPGRTNPRISQ